MFELYHSVFLIEKVVIAIKVPSGVAFVGNLALGTTDGEPISNAVTGAVEILGVGVAPYNSTFNVAQPLWICTAAGANSIPNVLDIDFTGASITNATTFITTPNLVIPITTKYLYLRTTTLLGVVANIISSRFTVNLEYSVY